MGLFLSKLGMKQKYHLISSIISMSLTCVLLIFVCLAWYVSNKEAKTTGVNSSIIAKNDLIDSVEYYEVNSYDATNSKFIFEKLEESDKVDDVFEMGTYNPLLSDSYPQRLVVINLKDTYTIQLTAKTHATSYLAENIKIDDEYVLTKEGPNSLTSVIGFYLLDINSVENTIIEDDEGNEKEGLATPSTSIDSNNELYFANPETDTIVTSLNLIEESITTDKIYILLDYYEESIEHIYSENIGNPALDPSTDADNTDIHKDDIKYTCDFYFVVKEVSNE